MAKYKKNLPTADWVPPVPAYSAVHHPKTTTITAVYIGIQYKKGDSQEFAKWFHQFNQRASAPKIIERAKYQDAIGYQNDYFICYWENTQQFSAWKKALQKNKWWNAPNRTTGDIGFWIEVIKFPKKRSETIFSSENKEGATRMAPKFSKPIQEHNYYGSMRDRIPAAANNRFHSPIGEILPIHNSKETKGERVVVTVPENLAIIRSGQNLTDCGKKELDYYQANVYPSLKAGMDFIRDNPMETGCCCNRFSASLTPDGQPLQKTFGFSYWLTLKHLENWSKDHPTHAKIFGGFMEMVGHFQGQIDLKLWHEVSVLQATGQYFEYINCHNKTGLLPWFNHED